MTCNSVLRAMLFFTLFLPMITLAQPNRPVVEDCMKIMDILGKDYSGVAPLQRDETLGQDYQQVLMILHHYIEPSYSAEISRNQPAFMSSLNYRRKLADYYFQKLQIATKRKDQNTFSKKYYSALAEVREMELENYSNELTALRAGASDNPFLDTLIKTLKVKISVIKGGNLDGYSKRESFLVEQKSEVISTGSALTFTNAIDAFTKVIVRRIKNELANQVFQKLRDKLGTESFAEIRVIFPITIEYLKTSTPDDYPGLLTALQQHIHEDLNNIINNLPGLENTQHVKNLLASNPELRFVLDGLKFIQQVKLVKSPLELIAFIENSAYVQKWANDPSKVDLFNLANGIKAASLIIKSLLVEKDGNTTIITSQAWETYAKDLKFFTTLFALLYEQNRNYYHIRFIVNSTRQELSDLFEQLYLSTKFTVDSLQSHFGKPVRALLYEANALARQIEILNEGKKKIGGDSITAVLFSSIECVQKTGHVATDFLRFLESTNANSDYGYLDLFRKQFDKYISFTRHPVTIYDFIQHKSYAAAANYAWTSIVEISGNPIQPQDKEFILKITNFLAEIERSKTSDDLVAAIDNFALPSGSSAVKRKSRFTVSLNTYPGLFLAAERLNGYSFNNEDQNKSPWAFNTALTVPVGISASWGTKQSPRARRERARSIFVSVIDIGAITSLRFQDDQSELPELEFKNIFAPGVHLYYGFLNSPFSIGTGIQFGPMLRELKVDNNGVTEKVEVSSFRLGLSLTIDIPILHFHNSVFK